jgi:hypothetical protein
VIRSISSITEKGPRYRTEKRAAAVRITRYITLIQKVLIMLYHHLDEEQALYGAVPVSAEMQRLHPCFVHALQGGV